MIRSPWFGPAVGTVLVFAMLAARALVADGWPWLGFNVALAWVPLVLGGIAVRHPALLVALGPVWLAFLPNAPYLLTDLVHLRSRPPVPLWFDVALLGGAGALGLGIGVVSLCQVARSVGDRFGWVASAGLYTAAPVLSGIGIWLGRVLRWNSWDLVLQPVAVLRDLAAVIRSPVDHLDAWAVTLTFAAVFAAAATFGPAPAPVTARSRAAGPPSAPRP